MDRITASDFSSREQVSDFKVRSLRGGFSNANRLIGVENMERFTISLGIDSDCLESEFVTSTNQTNSNFTTIGD